MSETSTDWIAFSVDLEPNKDDTLEGIRETMEWFDQVVPRGTVYATHRIATELPDVISMLSDNHEIAVHVHPREFGHEHDQLAELSTERQYELIHTTRKALSKAAEEGMMKISSFRAGRHSASEDTLDILSNLGFSVDASINVRYDKYLPEDMAEKQIPFRVSNGLLEVPTSYYRPKLISRVGLRTFPQRELTATANTIRTDSPVCSGSYAVQKLASSIENISMYMHPYDATNHHNTLENNGGEFRHRIEDFLSRVSEEREYLSASDLLQYY